MHRYLDHVIGVAIGLLFVLTGRWAFLHPEEKLSRFFGGGLLLRLLPGQLKNVNVRIVGMGTTAIGFSAVGGYSVPRNFWDTHAYVGPLLLTLFAGICTFAVLRRGHFLQPPEGQEN